MANDPEIISINEERNKKFLQTMFDGSFLAVVVADDGKVQVFSKDLEPSHLDRIKKYLSDLELGE